MEKGERMIYIYKNKRLYIKKRTNFRRILFRKGKMKVNRLDLKPTTSKRFFFSRRGRGVLRYRVTAKKLSCEGSRERDHVQPIDLDGESENGKRFLGLGESTIDPCHPSSLPWEIYFLASPPLSLGYFHYFCEWKFRASCTKLSIHSWYTFNQKIAFPQHWTHNCVIVIITDIIFLN